MDEASLPAIVTCVESGPLEEQVLRMVESLRRYGGRLANCQVMAVRPRSGMPLQKSTFESFDRLDVKFHDVRYRSRYSWYKFLNKPVAVRAAAERVDAPVVCWLDADILVVQEPEELLLSGGEDFTANCSDMGGLASTGPGSEHEPYWQAACRAVKTRLEDLPWLKMHRGHSDPVRFYFNGGVFAFRRDSGFADHYLRSVEQMLASHFKHPQHRCYFHEQVALGLCVISAGLSWCELTARCNFACKAMMESHRAETEDARLLHYHGAMQPEQFQGFVTVLQEYHPQVSDWLQQVGPLGQTIKSGAGPLRRLVTGWRVLQQEMYLRRCQLAALSDTNTGVAE